MNFELLLSSEASVTGGGNAFNLASATISAIAVFEPPTLMLLALTALVTVIFPAGLRRRSR